MSLNERAPGARPPSADSTSSRPPGQLAGGVDSLVREGDLAEAVAWREGDCIGEAAPAFREFSLATVPWEAARALAQTDPSAWHGDAWRQVKKASMRRVLQWRPGGAPREAGSADAAAAHGTPGGLPGPFAPGDSFFLKWMHVRGAAKLVGGAFRTSKVRREFLLARALLRAGIPTPAPVFLAERRTGPFLRDAWLLTRGLDPTVWTQAYAAWRAWRGDPGGPADATEFPPDAPAADALVRSLARAIKRCHERGFLHDDCRAHHWFFRRGTTTFADADALARWAVIDLDGSLWAPGHLPTERQRRRVLARLAASFHRPLWTDADLHLLLDSYWCGDGSAAAHDFEHVRRLMHELRGTG